MKAVFADAFYFVALVNRADQHHGAAVAAARQLRGPVVTTEWVLAEFADALAASFCRRLVPQFIRELERDPRVTIIRAGTQWFEASLNLYGSRTDKSWSLTDCISFAVMKDGGLSDALTGDRHFDQAGFIALLK